LSDKCEYDNIKTEIDTTNIKEDETMYQVILAEREKKTAKVVLAFFLAEAIVLSFAFL
jgi:hypothetical protein